MQLRSHLQERPAIEAPKSITETEKIKLWVRAGGRCELCNEYLLEDDLTLLPANLAELAHNVGRKQSSGSPRGLDSLPIEERNCAENLLLLCRKHHKVIDSQVAAGEFTVEELRRRKEKHEERIRYVTAMGEDAQTVVLRVMGDVRGAPVELSEETARAAVLANGDRYPFFASGYLGAGMRIDLRDLPAEGSGAYWFEAERRIADVVDRKLREGVNRGEVRHVSVFAIARIPLLVLLGHHLDDKVIVELYQKHRGGSEGWSWDSAAEVVSFESVRIREGSNGRVVLLVSLSGSVQVDRLPKATKEAAIYEIRPVDGAPNRNVLSARGSLEAFADRYHLLLSELERDHPGLEAIEVFPAVPVTAAVTLGRGRMRYVHPALRVYDRAEDGSYAYALEIKDR